MVTLKTKSEIKIMREGGRRHAAVMRKLVAIVRPGMETRELDKLAVQFVKEEDKDNSGDKSSLLGFRPKGASRPYPASICVSVNEEVVHGIPTENSRVLREGDIVSIDFGLEHCGMFTDMAVTVPVGTVDLHLTALMETTKKALLSGIKAAKGGKRVRDISTAIERVGLAAGYGIVEELVGHGVGHGVHEEPYVPNYTSGVRDEKIILSPGMTLAIEPMFNLGDKDVYYDSDDDYTVIAADGLPSAHFEHTVLITKGEAEILTA
ncbi:MAG: type I methionyl aminopeptidase [Patescibacteria group bacterium]|nr:type I methionyl aminopeptidase [Patescibacteria group bacterium]